MFASAVFSKQGTNMTKYLVVLIFSLLSFSVHADTSEKTCEVLKPLVAGLQKQAPIEVDYMTTLTGVQAILLIDKCYLNYNYVINSEIFLKEMSETNDLSKEDNIAFLVTSKGRQVLQDMLDKQAGNAAKTHFTAFSKIRGMYISYNYSFDDVSFPSIKAIVMNND